MEVRLKLASEHQRLVMIADDLTGANDSGVQFTKDGFESTVLFHVDEEILQTTTGQVLVVDTDSRALQAGEAYSHVHKVTEYVNSASFDVFYKKIDSTLRGNIGAEIEAIQVAGGFDLVVIAPAFPEAGRVTIDGFHYVNDVPIDQTLFAKDPHTPVSEAYIPSLIKKQTDREVLAVSIESEWPANEDGVPWLVFDARTNEDLKQIVENVTSGEYSRILWVGSAGLAIHVSKWFQRITNKKVLTVAGSASDVTVQQVQRLLEEKDVAGIPINPELLLKGGYNSEEKEELLQSIAAGYSNRKDILIYCDVNAYPVSKIIDIGDACGYSASQVSGKIAEFIGELAANVITLHDIDRLILTGGETAKNVSRALYVQGFNLMGEVETGIPISQMLGTNILAVTKAGAYGNEQSIVRAYEFLKQGGVHHG
ncbi:four-carbon acid sugar kinase family protein [Salicibibacter cibi]|uniref:Four-carbon acid sugar kinase family protein n=1 Tax=Salicibibacter cibi TaxID=2743001 RepID=A0A7T6Z9I6_9BACI|nr:four-carbon acid sugar kinase family protein [Salicibibacter cibi]QQK78896.1 four-carbon acid sugar kinase family protein [Salicibibacter cibi]